MSGGKNQELFRRRRRKIKAKYKRIEKISSMIEQIRGLMELKMKYPGVWGEGGGGRILFERRWTASDEVINT